MDQVLFGGKRIHGEQKCTIPRQQKCYDYGDKGKSTNSKQTKHIKVQYSLFKDKIDKNELELEYCPTDKIWSDILTKLIQGTKFKEM